MNELVYIPDPGVIGELVNLMAYGAIVKYKFGGIEFQEMLAEEDYIILFNGDDDE